MLYSYVFGNDKYEEYQKNKKELTKKPITKEEFSKRSEKLCSQYGLVMPLPIGREQITGSFGISSYPDLTPYIKKEKEGMKARIVVLLKSEYVISIENMG